MSRKPPVEFTLAQLDKLLAERCAEDDAYLAWRGISLDDSAVLAMFYSRMTEIRQAADEAQAV